MLAQNVVARKFIDLSPKKWFSLFGTRRPSTKASTKRMAGMVRERLMRKKEKIDPPDDLLGKIVELIRQRFIREIDIRAMNLLAYRVGNDQIGALILGTIERTPNEALEPYGISRMYIYQHLQQIFLGVETRLRQ
jgi:hypothetical protein